MIDIEFQLNGRKVRPNDVGNQLEKAIFSQVRDNITGKLRGISDPESGNRPKVIVKGRSLDNLSFEISGSPKLIEEVKRRLR